jgi:phosphoadenosine phosphosulfate reductase
MQKIELSNEFPFESESYVENHLMKTPCYEKAYRSLGAKTTSLKTSDVPAWKQDLKKTEERAGRRQDEEKTMERLRQLGYM